MKKIIIFVASILLILFLFITILNKDSGNYIYIPTKSHSYTMALCTKDNYCADYEIFCNNKDLIGIRFTGAAVQFPKNWQDPREEEARKISC